MAMPLRPMIEKAAAFQAKHYKNIRAGSTPFTGWFRRRAEDRLRDCGASYNGSPPLFWIDVQRALNAAILSEGESDDEKKLAGN